MKRLEDMGLATKLFGAFGIMTLLVGLVGWVGIHNMGRLERAGALLYQRDTLGIERIDAANLDLVYESRALRDMLLASNERQREQDRAEALRDDRLMSEQIQAANSSLLSEQGARILDRLHEAYAEFVASRDAFLDQVALAGAQHPQSALDLTYGPLRARTDALDALLKQAATRMDADCQAMAAGNEALYASNTRWMIGLVAIGLLLSAILGSVIARVVLRQVGGEPGDIEAAARKIAQGDLEIALAGRTGIAASVAEMTGTLRDVARQANVVASGDYSTDVQPRSDRDELGVSLRKMNRVLREAHAEVQARDWLKTGLARLHEAMQGAVELDALAARVVGEIASRLDAAMGALFVAQEDGLLTLAATYAYLRRGESAGRVGPGEGLVGQAALDKRQIVLREVPPDYVRIGSALGERVPSSLCITPFLHEGRLKGVLELGSFGELGALQLSYLQQAMPIVAISVENAQNRQAIARALETSQKLAEELQVQQEELRVANEELEEQTQRLTSSEEELRTQQEELQVSNEELKGKNDLLEQQKREVEEARGNLATKAEELALASKYKSEFLANMSHELRTPLNSMLLLAQSLEQNRTGNLNPEQVESVGVIHASGTDLLNLINEILDLAKIEAGHMELNLGRVAVDELADALRASFGHMARARGLDFEVGIDPDVPAEIFSDRKRLEQILRNLIGNAIKFTDTGSVKLRLSVAADAPAAALRFAVSDTGIGIARDKQALIFEAFRQADGTTTRRFGGTGLGLTISRELAELLGGRIQVDSEPGRGSTFALLLPLVAATPSRIVSRRTPERAVSAPALPRAAAVAAEQSVADDRELLADGEASILVVEDDPAFAAFLVDACRERGLKALAAPNGEAALDLAARYRVGGVILDLRLPGMDGMTVLGALKHDTRTRHIPVHVVSVDEYRAESLRRGAVGHAVKPLDRGALDAVFARLALVAKDTRKRVLVVEDDARQRAETVRLIANGDTEVDEADTGAVALARLRERSYDCVVLDLRLPDTSGMALLEELAREDRTLPPIVVHTASQLTPAQEEELRAYADSIVVKDVHSPERLLDEVSLFLHRVVSRMPENERRIIREMYDGDAVLRDRKVLVVDDDMRTTFALSRLLAQSGMQPLKAENGERALQLLAEHPDMGVVLMDIMMPVMDGYETMRRIRAEQRHAKLPIIALTAKAMPEDRAKCLEAGASDYLPKPVDAARLLSMLRVWLFR